MISNLILKISTLSVFLYLIYISVTQDIYQVTSLPVFAWILGISTFVLPALISKILTKKYFGIGYILSTLIYPLIYVIAVVARREIGIEVKEFYTSVATIIPIITSLLFTLISFKTEREEGSSTFQTILLATAVALSLVFLNKSLGLTKDSLLSLDFLQHNAVVMEMAEGKICITPNDCSNLFQKLGYTSYFHTIQAVMTLGLQKDLGEIFTIISVIFTSFSSILVVNLLSKITSNKGIIALGTLAAIFIFDLGAHSFSFFLPQTFVLILFLNTITEVDRKINFFVVLAVLAIIITSHFIIGTYLSLMYLVYLVFYSKNSLSIQSVLTIIAIIGIAVILLANIRGFSIEKVFQSAEIDSLGFLSNYYYPDNLIFILKQYGILIILGILGVLYSLNKQTESIIRYASLFILSGIGVYLLAPTYANKFFIGFGPFLIILVIYLIQSLFKKGFRQFLILEIVLLSTIPLYLINAQRYMTFYTQSDGKISAIVDADRDLISYINNNKSSCFIISDPYTQLMVRGQSGLETLDGQYQSLKDREIISEFTQQPTDDNYKEMEKLFPKGSICFIYSSRLSLSSKYANPDNAPWRNILYDYEINNNRRLENRDIIKNFLEERGFSTTYQDSNTVVFIRP